MKNITALVILFGAAIVAALPTNTALVAESDKREEAPEPAFVNYWDKKRERIA